MGLEFNTFVRKPFTIEATQVTEENLVEIADMIGRVEKEPNGTRYIQVNKKKIPNITKVYVGYWLTKMGHQIRAYSERTFAKEFVSKTDAVDQLIKDFSASTVKVVANG